MNGRGSPSGWAKQHSSVPGIGERGGAGSPADYRALVCEALYALYGRADRRGFVLARLRATYLWDGALSAAWRRALAPHRDYLEALLDPEASATRAAISSALSRADPHFAAVCKATGVPP